MRFLFHPFKFIRAFLGAILGEVRHNVVEALKTYLFILAIGLAGVGVLYLVFTYIDSWLLACVAVTIGSVIARMFANVEEYDVQYSGPFAALFTVLMTASTLTMAFRFDFSGVGTISLSLGLAFLLGDFCYLLWMTLGPDASLSTADVKSFRQRSREMTSWILEGPMTLIHWPAILCVLVFMIDVVKLYVDTLFGR